MDEKCMAHKAIGNIQPTNQPTDQPVVYFQAPKHHLTLWVRASRRFIGWVVWWHIPYVCMLLVGTAPQLTLAYVLIAEFMPGAGVKRRLHIQFLLQFGILFGPNIVPLWSKKFGKNLTQIFSFIKRQYLAKIKNQIVKQIGRFKWKILLYNLCFIEYNCTFWSQKMKILLLAPRVISTWLNTQLGQIRNPLQIVLHSECLKFYKSQTSKLTAKLYHSNFECLKC